MQIVLNPAADVVAVDPEFYKRDSNVLVLGLLIVWLDRFEVVGAMQNVIGTGIK